MLFRSLYQATLNPAQLQFAIDVAESLIERFEDKERGGFWQSPAAAGDLILKMKEDHDGAEPSGNSAATLALLKLGAITSNAKFTKAAEACLRAFSERLLHQPHAVPYLLMALDFSLDEPKRVVISGDPGSTEAKIGRAHV